jgi:hypothetical protein
LHRITGASWLLKEFRAAARLQVSRWFRIAESARRLMFGITAWRQSRDEIVQPFRAPRPASGMCEAQRADLIAACEGKITWPQYFAKWGNRGLTL